MQSGSKLLLFFNLKAKLFNSVGLNSLLSQIEMIVFPTFGGCHFNHLLCTRRKVAMLICQ